jgi:hypothetical protein
MFSAHHGYYIALVWIMSSCIMGQVVGSRINKRKHYGE